MDNWGSNIDYKKIENVVRNDSVMIGYPEGLPHSSGKKDLDSIAEINSTSKTHPRTYLKDGLKANKDNLKKLIRQEFRNIIMGKKSNLDKLGVEAVVGIQEFVKGDYYKQHAPNAKSTIMRKTSKAGKKEGLFKDKPLIDTSQTINGLTYKVERK